MNDDILDLYMQAGAIASRVLQKGKRNVRIGISLLELVNEIETMVKDEGADLAFPLNVSINENAAHDTAMPGDERTFSSGDVVKLDLGVHVNGYIADTATTVDLGSHGTLVEASMSALDRAIERSKVGVPIHDIGAAIQAEIETRGFKPISNLTGHGLDQYQIHTPPTIPNIGTGSTLTLQEGMVFAIEPFASTGAGFVSEGRRTEIFSQVAVKPVRLPAARRLIDEIRARRGLPFARRWTRGEKFEITVHSLIRAGVLHAYPVLHDVPGSLVSQHEHTLILLGDECIVTTR